jgi:hypothetical protein
MSAFFQAGARFRRMNLIFDQGATVEDDDD